MYHSVESNCLSCGLFFLILVHSAPVLSQATFGSDTGSDNLWSNASNWTETSGTDDDDPLGIPDSDDNIVWQNGGGARGDLEVSTTENVNQFNIDYNGATLTISGSLDILGNLDVGNNLTLIVTGSLVIHGSLIMKNNANLSISGSVQIDQDFTAGTGTSVAINSGGHLNVDGEYSAGNGSDMVGPGSASGEPCSGPDEFCVNSPLPIKLVLFEATVSKQTIGLNWITSKEENFDFFSIERSDDGVNFYEVSTVPGHGNSNVRIQYSFEDKAPMFGISYYRLNAIDYDGSFEIFKAIAVEYIPEDLQISIYPNPGNGSGLKVLLGLPLEARLKKVSIFELGGNLLFEKPLHTGITEITPEQKLSGGFYFAKFQIDNYHITRKLIVK